MKAIFISLGILAGSLLLGAAFVFASYISASNYGAAMEEQLEAKYKNNQNVLSNYTARVREIAQVPDMYTEDLKKVLQADLEGRYGESGSTATFQWIQERQLPFDNTLYNRLANTIEAGRNEFANNQQQLLDIKRSYQTSLKLYWRGHMLRLAGYPKVNLDDFKIIVLDDVTQKFETGVDQTLELRRTTSPETEK